MINVGERVPPFSLKTDDGQTVSRDTLKGKRVILYFYPKDDTSGCTAEACSFRDNLPAFETLGVPVYGVSPDDERSHTRFKGKHGLNFTLVADPERKLIDAVGLWVAKSMYGRKYMGVQRSTLVIGPDGRIEHVWEKVKPAEHAAEVLAYLRGGESAPMDNVKATGAKRGAGTARGKPRSAHPKK